MAFEGQTGISLTHSLSVVNDLNAGATSVNAKDVDALGASINGILHQFLYDGGRTLNDLTSGNLVGHGVWKKMNDISHLFFYTLPVNMKRQAKSKARIIRMAIGHDKRRPP